MNSSNPSDIAYKEITGFDQNRKPFAERTQEEHAANWARFFESVNNLPDDDITRNFLVDRPLNRVPESSSLFDDDEVVHPL